MLFFSEVITWQTNRL